MPKDSRRGLGSDTHLRGKAKSAEVTALIGKPKQLEGLKRLGGKAFQGPLLTNCTARFSASKAALVGGKNVAT